MQEALELRGSKLSKKIIPDPAKAEPVAEAKAEAEAKVVREEAAKPRQPGETEIIVDDVTGKSWTFTLPSAEQYRRVMGKRYVSIGEHVVMQHSPQLRTLMQECIEPKFELDKMLPGELSWLERQFWLFLRKDRRLYDAPDLDTKNLKPHDVLKLKSPFTGRLFSVLIPSAAEFSTVLPRLPEDRIDTSTGDVIIELSALDTLLDTYMDPALRNVSAQMTPMELEWLELTVYTFFHFLR